MSLTEEAKTFAKQGYLVVPGVLSPDEIPQLREILQAKLDQKDRTDLPPPEFAEDEKLSQIPFRPAAVRALRAILGDDYLTIPEYTAMSGKYAEWHRDIVSQGRARHLFDPEYRQVVAAIYLQDFSEEFGGGLEIVKHSHHAFSRIGGVHSFVSRGIRKAVTKMLPKFSIPSRAGDVVIFDFHLMHRASRAKAGPPPTKKMSLFWSASRKNRFADLYMDHLRERSGEIQQGVFQVKFPDSYHPAARSLILGQHLNLYGM